MADAEDPLIGKDLDGYIIEEQIGRGGMGIVYRAYDPNLQRRVAVKTLYIGGASDEMRQRFEREAKLAAGVSHANVVSVFDVGRAEGHQYIVMDLVEGPTLDDLIDDGPLEGQRGLDLFCDIGRGLHRIHSLDLVHRDVKPSNVLVQHAGHADERAMITDFGIARAAETQTALTIGAIGTPEYMAPETASLERATDRSDQYALALMFYEMLAGEHIFVGCDLPAAHRDAPVPDLGPRLPGASTSVRSAIARALDKDPARRFSSVEAFVEAVLRQEGATGAVPLDVSMEQVLAAEHPGALAIDDLVARVNVVASTPVTAAQIDGRAELFPQLFRRLPDGRVALRHPPKSSA